MTPRIRVSRTAAGYVRWTRTLQGHARQGMRDGLTTAQIATRLGIPEPSLRNAISRYTLDALPADLTTRTDLAARLALSESYTGRLLSTLGVPVTCWLGTAVLRAEDAERVVRHRQQQPIQQVRPAGHSTVEELAARWGIHKASVSHRLAGLPYQLYRPAGHLGAPAHLYLDADVARVGPSTIHRLLPPGLLTTRQLAGLAHRSEGCISVWVALGLPVAARTLEGHYGYRVRDVLRWLAGRKSAQQRRAGDAIRRALAAQQEAA